MEAYNIAKTPSKYANVNISCQMLICVACKIARLRGSFVKGSFISFE